MTINTQVSFYGIQVTRADLEELLAKADTNPEARVRISVGPKSNSPTDPGGEISISMDGKS